MSIQVRVDELYAVLRRSVVSGEITTRFARRVLRAELEDAVIDAKAQLRARIKRRETVENGKDVDDFCR